MMVHGISVKSCPFCGLKPEFAKRMFGVGGHRERYGVSCVHCKICIGWADTREHAAILWNRRRGDD